MAKVLIFDTSILCVWLKVPGKESCGSKDDVWDYQRVQRLIKEETKAGTTFVLPLATIIETGNHIAQATSQRYEKAIELAKLIQLAADQKTPWAAFTDQSTLWSEDNLKRLADDWPALAAQKISLGDATIKDVADFYSRLKQQVHILTGDGGLKAYEPSPAPIQQTRRRRRLS